MRSFAATRMCCYVRSCRQPAAVAYTLHKSGLLAFFLRCTTVLEKGNYSSPSNSSLRFLAYDGKRSDKQLLISSDPASSHTAEDAFRFWIVVVSKPRRANVIESLKMNLTIYFTENSLCRRVL